MNRLVAVLVCSGFAAGFAQAQSEPVESAEGSAAIAPPAEAQEYTPIPPPIVMPPKPKPDLLSGEAATAAPEPAPPPVIHPPPKTPPPAPALPPAYVPQTRRAEPSRAWSLAATYALPASSEFWDSGIGLEAQYRTWQWDEWGWAISGGYASWDSAPPVVPFAANGYDPSMEGSATLYSLGASMVHRTPVGADDTFLMEAGLRYVFFASDVVAKFNYENHYGQPTNIQVPVNVDDHLAAVVNFMYEMRIDADLSWFIGLGYQLDLTGTDTDWALETFDTATDGLRAQLGLVWKLD